MARFSLSIASVFVVPLLAIYVGSIVGRVDGFAALPKATIENVVSVPACLRKAKDSVSKTPEYPIVEKEESSVSSIDRRTVFTLATMATMALLAPASPALALKPKNEALCGTGFFEHIYEYKCTAIGDIEDEGYSKSLSQAESGLTDGLMGKLGVDTGAAFGDFETNKKQRTTDPKSKRDGSASSESESAR